MSRAPIIGGVVLIVIVIVTTVILMMNAEKPAVGPAVGPAVSASRVSRASQPPALPEVAEPDNSPPPPVRLHETDVINPPSDETPGDVETGMLRCVNTRRRDEMGWVGRGRWTTEEQAREQCKDYDYMSLECPMDNGFEVFCADDVSKAQTLLNRECKGDVEGTELNSGTNGHCRGPYKWGDVYGGGINRGALYKI